MAEKKITIITKDNEVETMDQVKAEIAVSQPDYITTRQISGLKFDIIVCDEEIARLQTSIALLRDKKTSLQQLVDTIQDLAKDIIFKPPEPEPKPEPI